LILVVPTIISEKMRQSIPMTVTRLFLIASSLARLIRKERGGTPVIEGYFPDRPDRNAVVHLEADQCRLALLTHHGEEQAHDWADLPRSFADSLMAVTAGQIYYLRTLLPMGPHEIHLEHFRQPNPLDLLSVTFGSHAESQEFLPPSWFGAEVSDDAAYQHRGLALKGLTARVEAEVTAGALHSLLDLLEDRVTLPREMKVPQAKRRAHETVKSLTPAQSSGG
jgi:CYTH domain-containing protein